MWAMNVSFAAHLQEDNKSMVKYHIFSYIITAASWCLAALSLYYMK